jgi:hypothetical protein
MRLAWCSGLAVMGVLAFGSGRPAVAQQPTGQVVRLGDGQTLTISGFINATWFMNSGRFGGFGQGQNAEWADSTQPATDKTILDGDVRNTRINFTFAGQPVLGKFSPRAVLEADFFGAFNGAPPFGDEQAQLRVRFAYVDLTNGRTTLRIGQFWSPLFGAVPVSLSHVAFPLGYGAAGKVGWRYPGVYLYHDLTVGKPVTIQLQLAAFEGSGATAAGGDPAGAAATTVGQGEASGMPQLEALLSFTKRSPNLSWNAYIVGHVDWKDTSAVGVATDNLTGTAVEVGGSINPGKLTVQGNFYSGKAIGQQFGHISQQGDVKGVGGWLQAGYDFTPRWSLWGFYGMDDPKEADSPGLPARARVKNEDVAGMLRFRAGRYALGLELLRANTTWRPTVGGVLFKQDATQVALTVMYTF